MQVCDGVASHRCGEFLGASGRPAPFGDSTRQEATLLIRQGNGYSVLIEHTPILTDVRATHNAALPEPRALLARPEAEPIFGALWSL